ncbi:FUSC family protein [Vagococcus xieshaowenii]|uniref:Aromatic acid exporter family member 1 n=1 Tax=Vagococcus xieshaowenii TaxID=2562451 RepID=A0AAJ5JM97_9ENTE|nr:aromatic acid exporter family protein [Vagococcus xieshaowenii]QCA28423.1 hypothetical protein E4Z98_03520 [Vagococcus xieshaowenii]TFZ42821.1 hypothetical protein E4031_02220 [Vagococcus xieshaowenii]
MPFGMRTFKTGFAVFLCILFSIVFNRETYIVSALTAIFTIRKDFENSVRFGKDRVIGNTLGALSSLIVITIFDFFGKTTLTELTVIPLIIISMITVLTKLKATEGTVGSCATLFTILFMIPEHQTYIYAFNRIIDSFIGLAIGLAVDYTLPNHKTKNNV